MDKKVFIVILVLLFFTVFTKVTPDSHTLVLAESTSGNTILESVVGSDTEVFDESDFLLDNLISLREAVELALLKNSSLHNSNLDIEQAKVELDVTYRNLLPQVSFQSSYTRLEESVATPTGEYTAVPTGSTFPVTVTGPGGVDFTVDMPLIATVPVMGEGSPDVYNTQVTLQQPIFVGGKAKLGIDLAKKGVELAEVQYEQKTAEVLYGVIQGYYNLVLAEEMFKVQKSSLELLEEHNRIAKVNYDAGMVLKSDLLQIDIEKGKALQSLKSSENGIYLAKRQLAAMLGLKKVNFGVIRPEETLKLQSRVGIQSEILYQEAIKSRSEMKTIEVNQDMLKTNLTITRRFFWPNLILVGNYGWKGNEFSFDNGNWNIMLTASMQVFDGGISFKKQEGVELQVEKLLETKENLSQMIKLEVEEALLKVEEAKEGLHLQELMKKSAEENLRIANDRYKAGVGTNLDVLNARTLWEKTEAGYVQSQIQYQLSMFKVLYKAGLLVDYCKEVMKSEK